MSKVDLGFPEERENAALWLCNRYFPSKIGGRPAWLELKALPTNELKCTLCEQPLSFLCQIYAPGEEEYNFHRSIYLFLCKEPNCQKANESRNFIVLRSQLPMKNDFYSTEPPNENGEPQPEIPAKKKLCVACGCPGPFACGRCRNVNYCSLKHQRTLWPTHKLNCDSKYSATAVVDNKQLAGILFPEYEIALETAENDAEENSLNSKDIEKEEKSRLQDFEKLVEQGKTGSFKDLPDEELEKYTQATESVDDKYFRRFKKLTSKEPEQILRYERGGSPLWIADIDKTVKAEIINVPACELCGTMREFEFQIMPQMLLLLGDDHLDWGILAIYTCPKSCHIPNDIGYVKEYIIKQDIIADNK